MAVGQLALVGGVGGWADRGGGPFEALREGGKVSRVGGLLSIHIHKNTVRSLVRGSWLAAKNVRSILSPLSCRQPSIDYS